MILGFKTKFPWGEPTMFEQKILLGSKIHTIRGGNRWKVDDIIHMATGVRTAHYKQFNKGRIDLQKVIHVQDISIQPYEKDNGLILIDGAGTNHYTKELLASQDGFDNIEQFWKWFNKPIKGQIIHWKDYRY